MRIIYWIVAVTIAIVLTLQFVTIDATLLFFKSNNQEIESFFKILAYLSAAVFFLYKALTGYFIVNLSLSHTILRQHIKDTDKDSIVVSLLLSKGDRSSLLLHDIKMRFDWGAQHEIKDISSIYRLSFLKDPIDKESGRRRVDFNTNSTAEPFLRLSAGESTIFTETCIIPSSSSCKIDSVVIGKKNNILKVATRLSYGMGQWRASGISLPIIDDKK